MKSITFKFTVKDERTRYILDEDSRICSAMRRFVYNRLIEGKSKVETNALLKERFDCNCILRNSAISDGSMVQKTCKGQKVYFGQFKRFQKGLISKEEFTDSKNTGIFCIGEANEHGNRLFKIDAENGTITYKRNRKEHYILDISNYLKENRKRLLFKIQSLMEGKNTPITFRLKNDSISLTYDETVVEKEKRFSNLMSNRVLGIDLNPNYFGISIIEFGKDDSFRILHKEVIDIEELQYKPKNKIKFELQQTNHRILRLCKSYRVSKLAIEDLKFPKNRFWSRNLNRLCKNQFRYSMVKQHLQLLCSTFGVEMTEVNAAYSSIIGNFVHGDERTPDMVAASIEIARRSYHQFRKGWFQPDFVSKSRLMQVLGNQWKEELGKGYQSWKGLGAEIKKSKLKYRFPLKAENAVLSTRHKNAFTYVYAF